MIRSIFIGAMLCAALTSYAQWSSSANTSDPIYRTGNVGVGTSSVNDKLEIGGGGIRFQRISSPLAGGTIYGQIYQLQDLAGTQDGLVLQADIHQFRNYDGTPEVTFNSGKVGIGISSPLSQLHLASNDDHEFRISRASGAYGFRIFRNAQQGVVLFQNTNDSNEPGTRIRFDEGGGNWQNVIINPDGGNVGIGIAPTDKLEISNGGLRLQRISSALSGGTTFGQMFQLQNLVGTQDGIVFQADLHQFRNHDGTPEVTINAGNVGIGTTSPDAKLTVAGDIHSREVKVTVGAGTGPDYVFEPNYNLPTLTEIETYIKANKHLPEVPSAKEMETNGINLSEMNMLLLKKVEELTLHLIEQQKNIGKMQNELNDLKKK